MSRIVWLCLFGFLLFTETVKCQTTPPTTPIPVISQQSLTWTDADIVDETIPNPFVFEVPEGYFISVTVSDVNMSNSNFIRIESGKEHQVDATQGRIFTNTVKGPYSYLFKTNYVNAYCETERVDHTGTEPWFPWYQFTVKFEQAGELTTTTTTSTASTVSVPPTESFDSVYITVNVNGRYLSEYRNDTVLEAFKSCVVGVAKEFCNGNNVTLDTEITTDYVFISEISQCPFNWPDSTTCVQITFRLPIIHNGATWTGYQLNSDKLEQMWVDKDRLDIHTCFRNYSFGDYEAPDVEGSIVWWAVGISLVIVAFVALLWFLRTFSSKVKSSIRKRQKRNSDSWSIVSRRTDSVSSLTPHYLQDHIDTPKFFDN